MGRIFQIGVVILALASMVRADQTITATFENFTEGQIFRPSFTDPLSEITFRDSTNPPLPGGFVIEYSSDQFGGGNYLTAGGYSPGPGDTWGSQFGFTGDLPSLANHISIDVTYSVGDTSSVILKGFDSHGNLLVQQAVLLELLILSTFKSVPLNLISANSW